MKRCPTCNETKSVDEFHKNRTRPDGLQFKCKSCHDDYRRNWTEEQQKAHIIRTREWKRRNPEKVAVIQRRASLKRLYGISPEEYDKLLAAQDGKCAVCAESAEEKSRPLAVDHDHATGAIRGLLCDACNLGLGCLRDSPVLLDRALDYLQAHDRVVA